MSQSIGFLSASVVFIAALFPVLLEKPLCRQGAFRVSELSLEAQ